LTEVGYIIIILLVSADNSAVDSEQAANQKSDFVHKLDLKKLQKRMFQEKLARCKRASRRPQHVPVTGYPTGPSVGNRGHQERAC